MEAAAARRPAAAHMREARGRGCGSKIESVAEPCAECGALAAPTRAAAGMHGQTRSAAAARAAAIVY